MKNALLIAVALLLTLSIVMTPTVARGPPSSGEPKTISFTGDLWGSDTLMVDIGRKGLVVYGPVVGRIYLTFSDNFDDFAGEHYGKLRITMNAKTGEVTMYCDFDWEYDDEVDASVPQYHLEGSGTYYEGGSYTVNLEDAAIYKVVPERKGKKGALHLEFVDPVFFDDISFGMTISDT